MKPIIPFSWLGLFFALTLPNLHAQPINGTSQPSVSTETQGMSTTILPSTSGSRLNLTEEQPKTESYGKNATNATAREINTPTTTALTSSRPQKKTTAAKSSTTQKAGASTTKASNDRGGPGTAVKLLIILVVLLLVFVITFRWLTRQTGTAGDAARRCSHGLQEQLRSVVRAIERCLGLSLWPRKRMENEEDAGEEEEINGSNGTAGASKVERGGQRRGEEEDDEEEDDEDQREEDGDSSDDYSSLEGMDLRERARQKQGEERPGEKERDSKTEGAEEDLTSITLGEESKEGAEEHDVTEL